MPEQPLLGLILRLVAGFIILAVLGYFLFTRFRSPSSPSKTASPAAVAVVTASPEPLATPTPSPTSSPSSRPTPTATATPQKKSVAQKPKTTQQSTSSKTVIIHSNPEVILLVPNNMDYTISGGYPVEVQK